MHHKFVPFQGAPQVPLNGLPLHGPEVHSRLEKLICLTPVFLRLIHGGVRILDQGLRILAVVGINTDANAGGDVKIVLVDEMSFGHRPKHSSRGD